MKKYKNKNLRVSVFEIIGLILFVALIVVSSYFEKQLSDTKGLLNIGKTSVDYIIQAPSTEQIDEISTLGHVDSVVPYIYRTTKLSSGKRAINATLFIIEDANNLPKTTFSDNLLVSGSLISGENQICLSNELAKNAGVRVGDTVSIDVDGTSVSLTVCGVFGSDYRYVGGSMLTILSGDVEKALKSYKYSGAYVASNDLVATKKYFDNEYVPMGDLRSREEFDSEEAYETYLETRNQSDTTKETFDTADFVKDVTNRNSAKMLRYTVGTIGLLVLAIFLMIIIVKLRASSYTKKNVLRDIKDNYTIEQEVAMYGSYFAGNMIWMLLLLVIDAVAFMLIFAVPILSIKNIAAILCTFVCMLIVAGSEKKVLKKKFVEERKKIEDEKRV